MDINIGARFKEIRIRQKFSQEVFAEKLGISQSKLSKIERGTIKPDIYDVARLCQETSVSFSDLINAKEFEFETLSPDQKLLLEKSRLLNDKQIAKLIDFIDTIIES